MDPKGSKGTHEKKKDKISRNVIIQSQGIKKEFKNCLKGWILTASKEGRC